MYVLSLGGSLVVPEGVDVSFLNELQDIILSSGEKFVVICGGGKLARTYQGYGKSLGLGSEDLDWVGIRATQLNAELVRGMLGAERITDFTKPVNAQISVGAGIEPGCSTDMRAVQAASFGGKCINLSNIDYVYDSDPRTNPDAKKFETLSWKEYRNLIDKKWSPGLNVPFDPVAAEEAEKNGCPVVFINNLDKLRKILAGEKVEGTYII
ncbi:MAG: UMP kinase [Candidatus Woesearchaeota archaeon]